MPYRAPTTGNTAPGKALAAFIDEFRRVMREPDRGLPVELRQVRAVGIARQARLIHVGDA